MSAYVLTDVQLLLAAMEMSPFSGEFSASAEAAMKDAGHLNAKGFPVLLPGITSAVGSIKGHADFATGAVNSTFKTASAGQQVAFSVIAGGSAAVAGSEATFMRGLLSKMLMATGKIGEVADFSIDITGDSAEVDGVLAAPLATRTTAAFTGTALQLGAVPATDRLWAALHVTAITGTNLAVSVTTDNAVGFPSPAAGITFATMSAPGWQFLSVPGPLTDDWFRANGTLATGTATYAVLFGVL